MLLTREDGTEIVDPTPGQIEDALCGLDCLHGNSFAILGGDWTYIQTAQEDDPDFGVKYFVLEYQAGSLDRHYRAADGPLDLDDVIDAFLKYAAGDPGWKDDFTWEKMDLGRRHPPRGTR
jgi:hypothetical protein